MKDEWKKYLFYVKNQDDFKRIRIKLNLTQEQYGNLIGITRQAVATIEKDDHNPRPIVLVALNVMLKHFYSDKLIDDLYIEEK